MTSNGHDVRSTSGHVVMSATVFGSGDQLVKVAFMAVVAGPQRRLEVFPGR